MVEQSSPMTPLMIAEECVSSEIVVKSACKRAAFQTHACSRTSTLPKMPLITRAKMHFSQQDDSLAFTYTTTSPAGATSLRAVAATNPRGKCCSCTGQSLTCTKPFSPSSFSQMGSMGESGSGWRKPRRHCECMCIQSAARTSSQGCAMWGS